MAGAITSMVDDEAFAGPAVNCRGADEGGVLSAEPKFSLKLSMMFWRCWGNSISSGKEIWIWFGDDAGGANRCSGCC